MGEWSHGLCACFDNCTLCLITYIAPCYTAGKNAEAVGDSCIMVGALYYLCPIAGIYFSAKAREKIREQKGIEDRCHTLPYNMGEWTNGFCGCLNNCALSLVTFVAPCYTASKNAEAVGDNCKMVGLLYAFFPLVGFYLSAKVREKIRERKSIKGSFGMDCVMHWFCPLCALVQDAQEIRPGEAMMARE